MSTVYEAARWREYVMDWSRPYCELEPLEREVAAVDGALAALSGEGILPHVQYDRERMLAHRAAVRAVFEVPWTAISPRMERLLYAVNAIARPRVMVAVGIFCGFTFIANAGAAVGPGAVYQAQRLVGLEIRPHEAARARRNVARLDPDRRAEIVAADGLRWLQEFQGTVDLLYLDADSPAGRGKSIYLDLLAAAWHALAAGSLVLAHNAVNAAPDLADYLDRVRDPAHMRASATIVVDDQGLEVSLR